MRPRLALLIALALLLTLPTTFVATAAAGDRHLRKVSVRALQDAVAQAEGAEKDAAQELLVTLAQTGDEETPEAGTEEEGTDAETETGAGEDAEPAEPEPGPIWTYQMAKISIALLVLMLLAMGGAYYRFVHKRQQEGI